MAGEINEPGEHWKGVQQFTLLSDRGNFYLAPRQRSKTLSLQRVCLPAMS